MTTPLHREDPHAIHIAQFVETGHPEQVITFCDQVLHPGQALKLSGFLPDIDPDTDDLDQQGNPKPDAANCGACRSRYLHGFRDPQPFINEKGTFGWAAVRRHAERLEKLWNAPLPKEPHRCVLCGYELDDETSDVHQSCYQDFMAGQARQYQEAEYREQLRRETFGFP